ncbi:alpha/beta hydrolase [Flagellimonas okinawensis]|uniref:Esterase family protein n=3 Tax=Flagellimonas TaxID=444459 RepID=A0A6G7J923_9FLAO|nr:MULTISPECIES: alpha/beta hydrolase-fold protein [Allomuricauda]MDF0708801.1 alpha/beta hydrolase-fold protein [[Muricauda] okinawensis]QII47058.1 esterase family protein [Allomuricauda oceani]
MKNRHQIKSLLILFLFVSGILAAQDQDSSYSLVEIPAPSLKDNLIGTNDIQKIGVYLPPSYSGSGELFPVVYFLNGYTVEAGEYPKTEAFYSYMKNSEKREFILIELNGHNLFEGSMYTNSPVSGNWEDFIVRDVVTYVDGHYRTLAKRESRGITGHSMGGGGTINISLKHPDVFSVVYAMSPAVLANDILLNGMFQNDSILVHVQNLSKKMAKVRDEDFAETLQLELKSYDRKVTSIFGILAFGSAFSPDLSQPLKIAFPFKRNPDGNFTKVEEIHKKWVAGFGNLEEKIKKYRNNLIQFKKFALSCGYQDEMPGLFEGSVYFSTLLKEEKIPHSTCWYTGNHTDKVSEQLMNEVFPAMSEYLNGEK